MAGGGTRSVPVAATCAPGRRTPSHLCLLLRLIYQLGFRGVVIRVAEENGGAACAWPSSAGWLRTSSRCASSRWAHLPIQRAVYCWPAPCTSQEGHGFATMNSSVQISISAHPTKQPYPPTAPTRWLELNYERTKAKVFHELVFIYLVDSGYQFHYSGANLRIFIAPDKIIAPLDKLPSKEFD
ncbi:Os05g0193800 [Oryza sativa Japonica Group]|uniref:Os05g0193800 protein n=3 Tax=Oryza sativa subsp. japonica TaxID=39947 RepID=Q688P6_ORYSJ|nr:unknown protein [Oryza sativa Japonica Group]BAG90674.1 unnamed protein product [Oryza sativa Japonica Group]BAH92988.1 Os05g0193800 [Oryza sativa Japonica Group]BAS92656.1 Os05g0193800 [Oryza sativa Japonica Group]|eukprot:NP_001174260.1 Os05g0193800 [Oryza sativa Japonica Group]